VSNQSAISKGTLTHELVRQMFDHTNQLLGVNIDVSYCPHSPMPINCFCRKPMPGMGVQFIEKYKLGHKVVTMVGDLGLSYTRNLSYC
jgi:histidinol phosphatase-like enzyme